MYIYDIGVENIAPLDSFDVSNLPSLYIIGTNLKNRLDKGL